MSTPGLPTPGELDWGDQLNTFIENEVDPVGSGIEAVTNHTAATDPHSDRAYANTLVSGFTTGSNGPNGFLKLDATGHIPSQLAPTGGGIGSLYDVQASFGATGNGTTDDSAAINTALTDVANAGGGWLWFPAGTYALASTLVIGSNTAIVATPGAVFKRIGNPNAPSLMLANYTSSSTTGANGILIMGGQWVADGPSTDATIMSFVNGSNITIRDTILQGVQGTSGNPAIFLAGVNNFTKSNVTCPGLTPTKSRTAYTSPVVQIENATSSAISGLNAAMYVGSTPCSNIWIDGTDCTGGVASDATGPFTFYTGIASTLHPVSANYHTNITIESCNSNGFAGTPVAMYNWKYAAITGNNTQSAASAGYTSVSWLPSGTPTGSSVLTTGNWGGGTATGLAAFKAANTSRTSTSLTADPDLTISGMAANGVYEVRASVIFYCQFSSPSLDVDFSLPSGAVMTYDLLSDDSMLGFTAGSPVFIPQPGDTVSGATFMGLLQMGSSAGTIAFKWAPSQNLSSSHPMFVDQGSYMILTRLA